MERAEMKLHLDQIVIQQGKMHGCAVQEILCVVCTCWRGWVSFFSAQVET